MPSNPHALPSADASPCPPPPAPPRRAAQAIGTALGAALGWLPADARAAHADFTGLGYALLGGGAGFLGGVALLIYLLSKRKPGVANGLAALAQGIVGMLAISFAGANMGALAYDFVKRSDQKRHTADEARYQDSSLKLAACSAIGTNSATEVRRLAQDAPEFWLTRLASECGLRGPANPDVYLAMMERLTTQGPPKAGSSYCMVLHQTHAARALPQLQALIDAKLPWDCPAPDGTPGWHEAVNDSPDRERDLQWLALLRKAGADFSLHTPTSGHLLHRISPCGAPATILVALEAGADPGLANPQAIGSPRVQWALRRHAPASEGCAVERFEHPLDRAAVARVDTLIGPLSEQDVNQQARSGETPLFAAYGRPREMAVLLRAGARIDTRSADGRTFLHAAPKLSPDAIALLASAPAEQLRALGRRPPGASPDGRAPQPSLLELARQRGDTALEALLCANGADGC